jgi:HK97 family phage prohead protease
MTELLVEEELLEIEDEGEWRGGPVEYRSAKVSDVSFPQREIELVVIPYEVPALIQERSRTYLEVVSRGAFGNVQRRAGGKIKVNLGHDASRAVGRVQTLYPNREEGLVAKLRISKTPDGNDTLELAADGVLDASAAFGLLVDKATGKPKPGAEVWETRNRRRLNHLWLDHVAMVSNPAHPGSHVIAVRNNDDPGEPARVSVATPNLAQVRHWLYEQQYEAIGIR